jgi:Domain of unknown function (DUF4189)
MVSGASTPWEAIGKSAGVRNVIINGGIIALGENLLANGTVGPVNSPPSWLKFKPDLRYLNGSMFPPVVPNVIDIRTISFSEEVIRNADNWNFWGIYAVKRDLLFQIMVVSLYFVTSRYAYAGSAVAIADNGPRTIVVKSYGLPQKIAEQHVIEICRREGGANAKLLASSDVVGYGAIAVARRGPGWIVGVSLGRRSATESEYRAIKACAKAGGTNPKVKWGFRG